MDQRTVMFGSGAGPRLFEGVEVTEGHLGYHVVVPSTPMPPMDSVTQLRSPEKRALYSGVLANSNETQLHDEVVDELLNLLLGEGALF